MKPLDVILLAQVMCIALMCVLYVWSARKRDMGVVDLGWTLGVALTGLLYAFLLDDGLPARRMLVALLGAAWAFRLAGHIFRFRVHGREEDARYQRLRAHWGKRGRIFIPLFFLAQAPLSVVFSLPLLAAMVNPAPFLSPWDVVGVAVWVIAVAGEGLADRQLDRFRNDPANRGKTCRVGLWGYSRHPNYFFEWVHWFAYVAFAVGSPLAGLAVVGPVVMLVFLFGITGIPHTERQALARRGDDYRHYQRTTSMFVPWFKRKEVEL
jgi:steroid 5-alpha reductase family enzyme